MSERNFRERGSALLLVLAALTSLSLLALLGTFSAQTDVLIAARIKREKVLRYAAESILNSAIAALDSPGPPNLPEAAFSTPWREIAPIRVRTAEGTRKTGWCLLPLSDDGNRDEDFSTPLVLYNRSFGYHQSPFERGGCPVFQLRAAVEERSAVKAIVTEITPLCLNPRIVAAWSASGPVLLEGRISISGFDHDEEGRIVPVRSGDLPGIVAAGEVERAAGIHVVGDPSGVVSAHNGDELPVNPLDVLNGGPALGSLDRLAGRTAEGEMKGIVYTEETFTGPLSGEGVLVVHNPLFRPGAYEASRLFFEEGIQTSEYDSGYSHLDPEVQPALLDIQEGGLYMGLVVADAVGSIHDGAEIRGGLVTLSRSPQPVVAASPLSVGYSSLSLERVSRGPLAHRLGQQTVRMPPEEICGHPGGK